MMMQAGKSIGSGNGASKEDENQNGSGQTSLSNKKGNEIVNPIKTSKTRRFWLLLMGFLCMHWRRDLMRVFL